MESKKRKSVSFTLDDDDIVMLHRLNYAATRAMLRTGLPLRTGQGARQWKSLIVGACLHRAAPGLLAELEAAQTPGDFPLS